MPLRRPETPEQKKALLGLALYASESTAVAPSFAEEAMQQARDNDDWDGVLYMLRRFYGRHNIRLRVPD